MSDDADTVEHATDIMPGDSEPDVDTADHASEVFDNGGGDDK